MNEGLNWKTIRVDDDEFPLADHKWLVETKKMVDRGFRKFCKKHPGTEKLRTFEDDITVDVAECEYKKRSKK